MSDKINIFLLDDSNNIIKTFIFVKPNSFEALLKTIREQVKIQIEDYDIIYYSGKFKEVKIDNDED